MRRYCMLGFKRRHSDDDYAALALLIKAELIDSSMIPDPEKAFGLELTAAYANKAVTYLTAVVLYALVALTENGRKFGTLLESFERIILPADAVIGLPRFLELKQAHEDLLRLVNEKKELTWATEWLEDVGYKVANPVRLATFAMSWMDIIAVSTQTIEKVLKKIK
jgi:hypothetical protein